MTLTFNIYSTLLLFSGIVSLIITILMFRRAGGTAVRWFGFVMLCISIWAITYGMELSSQTLEQMLLWIRFEYFAISFLPAIWLVFMITFTGKEKWLTKSNLFFIFLIPVITLLLVWTNNWHHLHYSSVSLVNSGDFPMLNIQIGIWYKVFIAHYYFTLGLGCYLLVSKFKKSNTLYKKQNTSILIGTLIPWIANAFYLMGFRPYHHLDITPFAFIATGMFVSFGLLRFRLLDIVPIAREKIIEALSDGVLVLDVHNRIIDMNGEMKMVFPPSIKPLIGQTLTDLLPSEKRLIQLIEERTNENIELILHHNEVEQFIEVEITPIFQNNTNYSGAILLFRDITEHKRSADLLITQAKELTDLNELKNRLFSIISHDLRAPLYSLFDLLNTKEAGLLSEQDLKTLLPGLTKNIHYTNNLLENLLYWSKNQLKNEEITPIGFDFKILSVSEVSYYEQKAAEKRIRIDDQIKPNTLVFADENMIRIVLRNLLSNAIKFCKTGDKITVSSLNNSKEVVFCVEDSGTGISDEVFEKLFRLETFTTKGTDSEQGTGLGLLLCKAFIEKNNGKITAESIWGKGSKFYFTLPKLRQPIKNFTEDIIETSN